MKVASVLDGAGGVGGDQLSKKEGGGGFKVYQLPI